MKVTLVLQRTWELDLEAPKNKDVKEMLDAHIKENDGDPTDKNEVHDAIRDCMDDDINSVIDLELDAGDFDIEVK